MDNKSIKIGFALAKITIEQFAIVEMEHLSREAMNLKVNFRFGADNKQKLIAVFSAFTFECKNNPFLIIEAGCHFAISDETWNQLVNKELNQITISVNLMQHLAMLTVGTTRGILHAKTENTNFNQYYLPTINVTELIKEDCIFKFENLE